MTDYSPQRFLVRPYTVDAMQYSADNCAAIHKWMGEPHLDVDDEGYSLCDTGIIVGDGELALVGDWIIRDKEGFFLMPNKLFQTTYLPLRRGISVRRWVVTAVALHPGGEIVDMAPVSRHLTLKGAKRAMGRYSTWENPNPRLLVDYQIANINEVRV